MAFEAILEGLLRALPGAQAVVLLDAQGELVLEAGDKDPRHRLVGAYQGITLSRARSVSSRYPLGEVALLASRYAHGQVVLHALKEGYYLILALSPEANLPRGARLLSLAAVELNKEL